jgi:[FeFe] hydrogenase (group B1/B3)
MRKFDTKIQHLKYKVLRSVARHEFNGDLLENMNEIPKEIVKGPEATMRCCIYKEQAIVHERVNLAIGAGKYSEHVVNVLDIACDECPVGGYEVTEACRGCIAHRCEDVCKRGAITFDKDQKAIIDKDKCVECGQCAKVCPYGAIHNFLRPCERACKIKAIHMDDDKKAMINYDKCIACGACVYQCPFGAIQDRSFILDVIKLLKNSNNNTAYKTYAVVAPSISSQFSYAKLGQVVTAIKKLGFHSVVEAALGADMVSMAESKELVEKGFLTSSCCPGFVRYVETQFPDMVQHVSHNLSPMATLAKYMKEIDKTAKIVFIGPCTAKKEEFQLEKVNGYVDSVITFEELQALFDSQDMDLSSFEETSLDNASYYGRIFARSGGLTDAVGEALKEQGLEDAEYKPIACDGIEECKIALLKGSKNVLPNNFIEGMACSGGCIGGAGCLTHGAKDKTDVDKYGKEAFEKSISDAISVL